MDIPSPLPCGPANREKSNTRTADRRRSIHYMHNSHAGVHTKTASKRVEVKRYGRKITRVSRRSSSGGETVVALELDGAVIQRNRQIQRKARVITSYRSATVVQ